MCFSPQQRAILRHLNFKKCSDAVSFLAFSCPHVRFATAACNFATPELQKVLRCRQFFSIFTSKCVFRHSGVQFFDIRKCSETVSFLAFSLQNVCFATAACNFSTSEPQKVLRDRQFFSIFTANVLFATAGCNFSTSELQKPVRSWRVLYILTSKCPFRHSGVKFLISPLTTWLRTRGFDRPTFRLTRHTNRWKNIAFRDFSNIRRGCIFFLLTFALLHLLSADLTTLLCFSTVHIVGSLLFKLPSINISIVNYYDWFISLIWIGPCPSRKRRIREAPICFDYIGVCI